MSKGKGKLTFCASGPLGPSKKGKGFGTDWNNMCHGTDGPVTCEICGTKYPERTSESYTISRFLGKAVVEECCGVILDIVYAECGRSFAEAMLEEVSDNPASSGNRFFLSDIQKCVAKARENMEKSLAITGEILTDLSEIKNNTQGG